MPGNREIPTNARLGTVQQDVQNQGIGDYDLSVNMDLSTNLVQPRKGWRVLRYPRKWEEADLVNIATVGTGVGGDTITITTTTAHGFAVGDKVQLTSTGSGIDYSVSGDEFYVLTTPDDTSFTVALYITSSTGSATGTVHSAVKPSEYRHMSFEDCKPLGSFVFTSESRIDYLLAVVHDGYDAYLTARTLTCQSAQHGMEPVGTNISAEVQGHKLQKDSAYGRPGSSGDNPDRPYVFAQIAGWVYFTNGGDLWRWSDRVSGDDFLVSDNVHGGGVQLATALFEHGADDPDNVYSYYKEIFGAKIVLEHNGSMVLGGFNWSPAVQDNVIRPGETPIPVSKDMTKGTIVLDEAGVNVIIPPNVVLFSDPNLPRSVPWVGAQLIHSGRSITGMASFNKTLVVFTAEEMYICEGAVGSMTMMKVSEGIGCTSHRSIAQSKDGVLMWLANDGVYAWTGTGRPQKVSNQVDALFRGETFTSFPQTISLKPSAMQLPMQINRNHLELASGTFVGANQYYAVAITAGVSSEWNNVVLCISPKNNRCWFYASQGETMNAVWGSSLQANERVAPSSNAALTGSACTGVATLMVSRREPTRLLAQGFYISNAYLEQPSLWRFNTSICAMDHEWGDQRPSFNSGSLEVSESWMYTLIISSRVFLGISDQKRVPEINLKLYATHNDEFGAGGSPNPIVLTFMPELSSFDADGAADSNRIEYMSLINPWPHQYEGRKYFFQDSRTDDNTINKYNTGGAPANPIEIPFLSEEVFGKRVHLQTKGGNTEFYRISLSQAVKKELVGGVFVGNPTMKIIGWQAEVKGGFGEAV